MNEMVNYSVNELHKMYDQFCCPCDEIEMYDQLSVVEKTEGLHVWFKGESEPYLDLVMGYSTLNLGHQHPRIRQVSQEAVRLRDHIHSFNCESKILLNKILDIMDVMDVSLSTALVDGLQSLNPPNFKQLMTELKSIAQAVGRYI